jgi:hypothetical protein
MSRTSNQVLRPSGLRQSANGQYIYANCVITGKPTFFKPDYFKLVLDRDFSGDENKMAKGYVCKDVKKLRKAGKTDEQIAAILGKFDPKAPKAKKHPDQIKADAILKPKKAKKVKAVTSDLAVVTTSSGSIKPVERVVYPWSDNPTYFCVVGADRGTVDFAEVTKDSCIDPPAYLDRQCEGCPVFDVCTCNLKIAPEDRAKAAKRQVKPVIKPINLVSDCFDKPEETVAPVTD